MSEAVLAKHEALLLRLMRIESAEEFYDEVDTAAGTWLEDLGLRDAIAKLALQDAGQGAADYVVGAWERARKRKAEADAFFKTASNTQSEHNIEEPAPALQPEWLQWQIENPGKELRPAEAFMAAVAAGDRARADAIATDVVHELEGTPDVGKVEWWVRQEIERAWPPAKEPEEEGFEFHESDKAGEEPPITIEERDRLVAELAGLYKSKPFEYAEEKKKLAKRLGVPQDVVHKMAIAHRQREPKGDEDHEQCRRRK